MILSAVAFSVVLYKTEKRALLKGIDTKLLAAAYFAKNLLPADYHDKIANRDSVSKDEYLSIVDKFNRLCLKLNLQYMWSLLRLEDQIVFTTGTSTSKDSKNGDHAPFFDVHTNPDIYQNAFNSMEVQYSSFHDKWGAGRMVLIPFFDARKRVYLFAASMSLDYVQLLLNKTMMNAFMISGIIFCIGLLISIILANSLSKPMVKLRDVAKSIANGDLNQTVRIKGSLELQSLSTSIASMSKAIEKRLSELHHKNEELEQTELALRESEEQYRTLVDNLPVAVYRNTPGPEGAFLMVNPAFCEILGFKNEEDAKRGSVSDIYENPRERKQLSDSLLRKGIIRNTQRTLVKKDGTPVQASITAQVVYENGGKASHFDCIFLDVTGQKELEDRLQRLQKMEAIGTLAGGVAHDLNNILGGLVSYPELLLLQLPEDSPLRSSVLTIQKSGEKAAAVVQDLLTLARRGVAVTEVVHLNDVISEYLKSPEFQKLLSNRPGIRMETQLEKSTLNILGSSIHLSKTVMNLVSNAAEAVPHAGKLTISTENRYIDRPVSVRGDDDVKEGDYVVLTISDTGTGISPGDMEKIFEPFYSKKKMGKSGTGLGMAVIWGTVKDHNGYIDVRSTEGKGTTFTLYFPGTREKIPEDKSHLAMEAYTGNGESILIVDDMEEQRKVASVMLKQLCYSVASVASGEEAVEYLTTHRVDLLVLDMIMYPGMDGLDTYKKILELHPGQKAIIASGFSDTDSVKEVQSLGAGAYIRKPLLLEKFGLAVKEELRPKRNEKEV